MQVILQIVASVLAITATWFVGQWWNRWYQSYRDSRQKSDSERIKKESEALNQKANEESDRLKQIEGR